MTTITREEYENLIKETDDELYNRWEPISPMIYKQVEHQAQQSGRTMEGRCVMQYASWFILKMAEHEVTHLFSGCLCNWATVRWIIGEAWLIHKYSPDHGLSLEKATAEVQDAYDAYVPGVGISWDLVDGKLKFGPLDEHPNKVKAI